MAKRSGFPGGGGNSMNQLMKQAQKMQEQMIKAQEELSAKTVEATAGGGFVTVTANGKKEIISIKLKPEVVDPDDIEMLEDLVVAAVNEVMRKVDDLSSQEMSKISGGLSGIPGMPGF